MKDVLIIEDNVAEVIYAQAELTAIGLDFRAVTNLSEGLTAMPEYDAVLSDLFFPAGNISTEPYVQRFLPLYENFKRQRFPKLGQSAVLNAVKQCADTFGIPANDYVENVMAKLNTPPIVLKAARDALAGIKDSEKYDKFLAIEKGIRDGTNLPLGIIASEIAHQQGRPSVIVTSTYHHDDAFEPVKELIKVPYRDTLVAGRKDWKGGIQLLSEYHKV